MLDYNQYWKRLVSNGLRFLQGQGNADAVAVIKNAELDFDIVDHDNWDGGIDYWELRFRLKYKDYRNILIRLKKFTGNDNRADDPWR